MIELTATYENDPGCGPPMITLFRGATSARTSPRIPAADGRRRGQKSVSGSVGMGSGSGSIPGSRARTSS